MTRRSAVALSLALMAGAQPVLGQEVGDRLAGKALALSVCAECHFVADEQVEMPSFDAPPFSEVAADPAVTDLSLRVFFQTPHNRMPNLILTETETDDVIAYILSLRPSE